MVDFDSYNIELKFYCGCYTSKYVRIVLLKDMKSLPVSNECSMERYTVDSWNAASTVGHYIIIT